MVEIKEVIDKELLWRIQDHQSRGGALNISVFNISPSSPDDVLNENIAHLITAREALEKANFVHNFHMNKIMGARSNSYTANTNHDLLEQSGKVLSLAEFLGPYFNIEKNKPIVRGVLGRPTEGYHFYYDDDEIEENILNIESERKAFWDSNPNNPGGFIYALTLPPYPMKIGDIIKDRGQYILDFMQFFFSDIHKLKMYSWSTESSIIFATGDLWWGSFFYTVYNPIKDWYIGIIASRSD